METLTIENNDAKLYTSIHPNAGRETIILLHGGPGVPDDLISVTEMLASSFQIISFHQRGTGLSPSCKDYSLDRYLSDIDTIARCFKLDKFHLFGHSWGGLYAQIYAEYSPGNISSLFLCSPSSGTGKHWQETETEVMKFNYSKCSYFEFLNLGLNSLLGMFGNNRAYQRLFAQVIKNYNKGFTTLDNSSFDLKNVKAIPINLTRKQLLKGLELKNTLNPPYEITVTYGSDDIYGASKNHVKKRYPSGEFITIEDCGHLPWLHNRAAFEKILQHHFMK